MQCKDQVLNKFQFAQRRKYFSRLVLDFLESGLVYPHEKTTVSVSSQMRGAHAPMLRFQVEYVKIKFIECSRNEYKFFLHQPFARAKPQARPQVLDKKSSHRLYNASNIY